MARKYSNISKVMALSAGINTTDGSMTVNDATGLPVAFPYALAVDYETASVEIVLVTAAAGNTLTITRGQEDTPGKVHSTGAVVVHCATALDLQNAADHIEATQNVHGVGIGSAVVGTNSTQTLTNKTIDGDDNTLLNIPDSALGPIDGSKIVNVITTATIPGANVTNPIDNLVVTQPNGAGFALDVQGSDTATIAATRIRGRDGQDALRLQRNNATTTGLLLNCVTEGGTSIASINRSGNAVVGDLNANGGIGVLGGITSLATIQGATLTSTGNVNATGNFVKGSRNINTETIPRYATVAARTADMPSPTRGQLSWTDEKATVEVFDNAAWRPIGGLGALYATSSYSASLAASVEATVTPWTLVTPPSSSDFWTASGSTVKALVAGSFFITVGCFVDTTAGVVAAGRMFVDFSAHSSIGPFNGWTRSGFGDGRIEWTGCQALNANETISVRVESGNSNMIFDRVTIQAQRVA